MGDTNFGLWIRKKDQNIFRIRKLFYSLQRKAYPPLSYKISLNLLSNLLYFWKVVWISSHSQSVFTKKYKQKQCKYQDLVLYNVYKYTNTILLAYCFSQNKNVAEKKLKIKKWHFVLKESWQFYLKMIYFRLG